MSLFTIERLSPDHDQAAFCSGLESVDKYRLGVDKGWQGQGLGEKLIGLARHFALQSIEASGGVGLVVDAANEALIPFYEKFGFRQVEPGGLRLFLPTASLLS